MKTHPRCLQKKYEESQKEIEHQKLKIDVLEAEKLTLQAEKTSFEARFEEVNLKLKLKTAEYDSLLAKRDGAESSTQKQSMTEDEPIEITKTVVGPQKPTPIPRKRQAGEQCSKIEKKRCIHSR